MQAAAESDHAIAAAMQAEEVERANSWRQTQQDEQDRQEEAVEVEDDAAADYAIAAAMQAEEERRASNWRRSQQQQQQRRQSQPLQQRFRQQSRTSSVAVEAEGDSRRSSRSSDRSRNLKEKSVLWQRAWLWAFAIIDLLGIFGLFLQLTPRGLPLTMDALVARLDSALLNEFFFPPTVVLLVLVLVGGVVGTALSCRPLLWLYASCCLVMIGLRCFLLFEMSKHETTSERTALLVDVLLTTACILVESSALEQSARLAIDLRLNDAARRKHQLRSNRRANSSPEHQRASSYPQGQGGHSPSRRVNDGDGDGEGEGGRVRGAGGSRESRSPSRRLGRRAFGFGLGRRREPDGASGGGSIAASQSAVRRRTADEAAGVCPGACTRTSTEALDHESICCGMPRGVTSPGGIELGGSSSPGMALGVPVSAGVPITATIPMVRSEDDAATVHADVDLSSFRPTRHAPSRT